MMGLIVINDSMDVSITRHFKRYSAVDIAFDIKAVIFICSFVRATHYQRYGRKSRMNLFGKPKGKKYHTRTIEVNTYEYDEQRLVVEGCLADQRLQEYHLATGEKRLPGLLHQMIIHMLVNKTTLEIEDLHVEMPAVPREECLETINSLEPVKGLRIKHGFTSKVKALAGSGKGCNHLAELLTAMGSSTIQGYAAYKLQESSKFTPNMFDMLLNTCWTWRAEGALVNFIKEKIASEQKE